MIQASELRIGNLVNIPESAINAKISAIGSDRAFIDNSNIDLDDMNSWFFYDSIRGMPLTYDLLTKHCGFIDKGKNGAGCRLDVNSADELCFYVLDNELRYQTQGSGFTRNFNIKYLHNLQNIFYILTGKELEIKL